MTEPYTLLRAALSLYEKPPSALTEQELQRVRTQATNELAIESRVLASAEALGVVTSEREIASALAEIRARFDKDEDFFAALANNHLTESKLWAALARQCQVEAIMARVAARAPMVSEAEIGIFYHSHAERFQIPQRRDACHILISINPDYPENSRERARSRIDELAGQLQRKPDRFTTLAMRHSECPTALQGGALGVVARGRLYPELDEVLFALKENQIGPVIETEIGFHLLKCRKIWPAHTLSLKKATPEIRKLMQERYRQRYQRAWLASLMGGRRQDD